MLRKEHKLKVLENWEVRRVFGPKGRNGGGLEKVAH
jgi:hypothetical protein